MKNLIELSVFLLLCLFGMACNKSNEGLCELGPPLEIGCFQVYEPVCGCDDVTYGNECEATAAGVPTFSSGECP